MVTCKLLNGTHMTTIVVCLEKFSRHLIIRIPKTAFKDNSHVGAFISEVLFNLNL